MIDAEAPHIHVPDPKTVAHADVGPNELIFDISCKTCGRSGAFRLFEDEVDW